MNDMYRSLDPGTRCEALTLVRDVGFRKAGKTEDGARVPQLEHNMEALSWPQ